VKLIRGKVQNLPHLSVLKQNIDVGGGRGGGRETHFWYFLLYTKPSVFINIEVPRELERERERERERVITSPPLPTEFFSGLLSLIVRSALRLRMSAGVG
jgi:hypothetical protein